MLGELHRHHRLLINFIRFLGVTDVDITIAKRQYKDSAAKAGDANHKSRGSLFQRQSSTSTLTCATSQITSSQHQQCLALSQQQYVLAASP